MFTKNLKDQFSADLLNTVHSVLGEAKHKKDCECEKCEKEDDEDEDEKEDKKDEMKEEKRGLWDNIHAKRKRIKAGSGERMRKPGSKGAPTNADFKAASEEVEPVYEISKATMGRYINRAKDQIGAASYKQGYRDSSLGVDDSPVSTGIERKLSKRHKGIKTAVSKLTKEEADQIDETINFKALNAITDGHDKKSYSDIFNAHGNSIHDKIKAVRKERDNQPGKTNHATFLHDKMLKAYASWYRNKKAVKEEVELDEGITNPEIKKAYADLLKTPGGSSERKVAIRRYMSLRKNASNAVKEEAEQIDELSKKTLGSYVKKASNQVLGKGIAGGMALGRNNAEGEAEGHKLVSKAVKRMTGIQKAAGKLTKEEQDFIDALNNDTLEEAASTNTTHGYHGNVKVDDDSQRPKAFAKMHAKVKKLAHEGGHLEDAKKPNVMVRHFLDSAHGRHIANNPTDKEITSRFAHFAKSYNPAMHEEVELEEEKNLTGLPKSTAEKNKQYIEITHLLGHKRRVPVHPTNAFKALNRYRKDPSTKSARIVSEDIELEEGRGRPPKEGSAAWHAKQKQDNDDMPALGVQLRKAKSMNKKVRFMDGKEHEIAPHHVDKFEDHMAARKTSADKAAFQKQAHKSHAEFVKAVSASVPKSSKDTGEIVRYRH